MRTLMTFLACSGFIVWAHSCDKRILGVQTKPVIQEPLATERPSAGFYSSRQYYIKELFSAAAFTMVGSNPRLYMASFRYLRQHNYFSPRRDSAFIQLNPRYIAH